MAAEDEKEEGWLDWAERMLGTSPTPEKPGTKKRVPEEEARRGTLARDDQDDTEAHRRSL